MLTTLKTSPKPQTLPSTHQWLQQPIKPGRSYSDNPLAQPTVQILAQLVTWQTSLQSHHQGQWWNKTSKDCTSLNQLAALAGKLFSAAVAGEFIARRKKCLLMKNWKLTVQFARKILHILSRENCQHPPTPPSCPTCMTPLSRGQNREAYILTPTSWVSLSATSGCL